MTTLVICKMGKTTHPANNAVDTYLAFSVGPPDSTSGAGSVNKKGRSAILRRMDLALRPLLSDSLDQLQLAAWTYQYGFGQPKKIVLSTHISYYEVLTSQAYLVTWRRGTFE
jgi:hypothetical protein